MSYENILVAQDGAICLITINRPSKLNALNRATIEELSLAFSVAEGDKSVRAVIVTGSGEKAFVAGADIAEFANFSVDEGAQLSKNGHDILFDVVENMRTPVIAAVNGFALGGGLELAMSCHVRVASDNARMGLPEVTLGVIPGYGGTQRLAQLVGKGKAMEMVSTGEMIKGEEAHRLGLVNHLTTQEALMEKCMEIAKKMVRNSPVAIGYAIEAINAGFKDGVNGYATEIKNFGTSFGTEDFKEGTTAFLEKRRPNFPG